MSWGNEDEQLGKHTIADPPWEFVEAVINLIELPDLRANNAGNAFRLVREKYNWDKILPRFADFVDRVFGSHSVHLIQNRQR